MANSMLAVPVVSHNLTSTSFIDDTAQLTALFLMAYQYHVHQAEPEAGQFITTLQQLVGLGYKACKHTSHRRHIYRRYREQFMQYDNGDFRKHLSLLDTFSENLAHMLQWAIQSYRGLKYPDGYETFLELLETLLNPEKFVSMHQQAYAYQLFEELRQLG